MKLKANERKEFEHFEADSVVSCVEKGTVENINGLIRRFFPKGTDFNTISEEQIAYVEDWINNRPMKILNYMTPKQKLQHFSVAIAS